MSKVRTRFAPSPTGRMHVGNLRTALYAYLIAKHEDGDFLLRIEDTDQERFVEGALEIIYRTLEKTGLIHDEGPDKDGGVGPYVQSERQQMGLYLKYAKQLIEQGDAYYCFCDKERLESLKTEVTEGGAEIVVYDKHCLHLSKEELEANLAAGKPYVIRINMPTEGTTTFHDEIYGDITVPNAELDDMILIKSDGYPTYNFANVIDDHLQGITHVVRGNEYLSSAPKYNRLYEAFGWEVPTYVPVSYTHLDSGIKTQADLAGKVVDVQTDSSAQKALEQQEKLQKSFKELKIVADYNTAFMDLESGAVDAIAMDIVVAKYQIEQRKADFVLLDDALASEEYAVGFLKGNDELRDKVQKTLEEMAEDGTIKKISEKWFQEDITTIGK